MVMPTGFYIPSMGCEHVTTANLTHLESKPIQMQCIWGVQSHPKTMILALPSGKECKDCKDLCGIHKSPTNILLCIECVYIYINVLIQCLYIYNGYIHTRAALSSSPPEHVRMIPGQHRRLWPPSDISHWKGKVFQISRHVGFLKLIGIINHHWFTYLHIFTYIHIYINMCIYKL